MIKCIAIDDEPLALKQMNAYINKTPFLELIDSFDNAMLAQDYLETNSIDLMFVDINMPDLNGMDFVKTLINPPLVIFTTAYSEYAIEGFKVDALDYILKPIGYNDFLRAAEKAKERLKLIGATAVKVDSNEKFLFIKSEYKILRVNLSEIKYIEGMREYIRIHLQSEKPIMSLMSLKKMEEHLPNTNFMRVHRSYIVNLDKVSTIERNRIVFDGDVYIPISEQYKEQFQNYLDNNFLI